MDILSLIIKNKEEMIEFFKATDLLDAPSSTAFAFVKIISHLISIVEDEGEKASLQTQLILCSDILGIEEWAVSLMARKNYLGYRECHLGT